MFFGDVYKDFLRHIELGLNLSENTIRVYRFNSTRERAKVKARYDWLWFFDPARRMGETGTRQMLEETEARVCLANNDNIQPYTIRRAYATRCLAKGMDLKILDDGVQAEDVDGPASRYTIGIPL